VLPFGKSHAALNATAIVSTALLLGAGCGGGGSAPPEDGPAGPNSIVWTVRAPGNGGSNVTTKWVGASFSGGCFQGAMFQAFAEATSTKPSSNIIFIAPMALADWPRLGDFQLSDSPGSISAHVLVDGGAPVYKPDASAPGTMTVATFDANTRVVTGTFQFDSVADAPALIDAGSVEGSFNFPCFD
jgi:hypothetical protein